MTRNVYLGLGSNYGDRLFFLQRACNLCAQLPETSISRASSIYETSPVGLREQPLFYNAVIKLNTRLETAELFRSLKLLETKIGRIHREHWGMREIDIDIILDDDLIIEEDQLIVPHPRMHERKFVLVPLAEIAPDMFHPVFKCSVKELLLRCSSDEKIVKTELKVRILN